MPVGPSGPITREAPHEIIAFTLFAVPAVEQAAAIAEPLLLGMLDAVAR